MHYCIGDIHGCFDEMMILIKKIYDADKDAQIIFVGDFPDRGPKVWETMNWVATYLSPVGNFRCVLGNHDRLLMEWYYDWLEWYRSHSIRDRLLNNLDTGTEPKPDYDFYEVAQEHKALNPLKLNKFFAKFYAMPYHIVVRVAGVDDKPVIYDIVHGWYTYDYPDDSYGQRMFNVWARECDGNRVNDHIIVHGHTPTITEVYTRDSDTPPGMIAYRKNAINLDGGCCYYDPELGYPCNLCGICLETLEEFYAFTLDERLGKEKAGEFRSSYYSKENIYREEIRSRLRDAKENVVPG